MHTPSVLESLSRMQHTTGDQSVDIHMAFNLQHLAQPMVVESYPGSCAKRSSSLFSLLLSVDLKRKEYYIQIQ